jgi:thymidylate synthase ThyX
MYYVKMIADSITQRGHRLSTLELTYPRFIHSQVLTHRVFSRNASSSRAIPVHKMLKAVSDNPVYPFEWGANEPGMQAHANIPDVDIPQARQIWRNAVDAACSYAGGLSKLGVHKQIVNRLLEPFTAIKVILTGTEFDGFLEQRQGDAAQPEIQWLANEICKSRATSVPDLLRDDEWHLPYTDTNERNTWAHEPDFLQAISVARCARVSYNNHNGIRDIHSDHRLWVKLRSATPPHSSPFEHVATPGESRFYSNFYGWQSLRHSQMPDHVSRKLNHEHQHHL